MKFPFLQLSLFGSKKQEQDLGVEDGEEKPKRRKPKEVRPPWTYKDRLLVGGILLFTILLGIYFWFDGQGEVPEIKIPNFFEEKTIIIEK